VTDRCRAQVQGPPGAHVREGEFAVFRLSSTGMGKPAICSPISGRGGTPRKPSRLPNAAHCVCLAWSPRNSLVRASGTASGSGVRLRSNVRLTEPASRSMSKLWVWASLHTSKKSFIRLFAIPRTTIAWNFSAITASGGYARSTGAARASSTGKVRSAGAGRRDRRNQRRSASTRKRHPDLPARAPELLRIRHPR